MKTAATNLVTGGLLQRAARLSAADWRDTFRASVCLLRVGFVLRKSSLLEILEKLQLRSGCPPATPVDLQRAQQAVGWAHRLVPLAPNCLLDSLASAMWLKSRGVSLPLVIGVRQTGSEIEAHAWLEGSEPPPDSFRVLWRSHGSPQ